jgi:hypothetical protein
MSKKEPVIQKEKQIPMKVLTQIILMDILRMRKLLTRYNPVT